MKAAVEMGAENDISAKKQTLCPIGGDVEAHLTALAVAASVEAAASGEPAEPVAATPEHSTAAGAALEELVSAIETDSSAAEAVQKEPAAEEITHAAAICHQTTSTSDKHEEQKPLERILEQQHQQKQQLEWDTEGKKPKEVAEEEPALLEQQQRTEQHQRTEKHQKQDQQQHSRQEGRLQDNAAGKAAGTADRDNNGIATRGAADKAGGGATATVAPAAAAGRIYSIQQMMRYAAKSQRPYHPRVSLETCSQGPASLTESAAAPSGEALQQVKPGAQSSSSVLEAEQQQKGQQREEGLTSSEQRLAEGEEGGAALGASRPSPDGPDEGKAKPLEAPMGQEPLQGPSKTLDDYFRSCFCE